MKNKNLFFKIYLIFLIVVSISIITLDLLGRKERIGYLSEFNINVDKTLELNNFNNIEETKKLFITDNELNYDAINNYIFTNELIKSYSYDFRVKYYNKIFRNSDIYGVYIYKNEVIKNNNFIKEINMNEKGGPFGNLVSYKIIDEKIDNINYFLKLKYSLIFPYILFLFIVLLFCLKNNVYNFFSRISIILVKNKTIIKKITLIIIAVVIVLIILFSFLGKKDRVGYLSEFKINIDDTLELNGLDIEETKQLFTIDYKLDGTSINNFILTNRSITNYVYDFRIKYYSKIFRNSDIYEVYPYLNNLPNYIKSAKMNDRFGTPFGSLISMKGLKYYDKIDAKYYLMINFDIFYYILVIFIIVLLCVGFYLINEYWKYIKKLDKNDYIFIKKIELITFILFIFRILLFYPGVYADWDNIISIIGPLFANSFSNNWHPVIIELGYKLMYKANLTIAIFFIINTLLLYGSIFIIVNALYLKYKCKLSIMLFFIIFISQIFFYSNEITKDSNATLYTIFSYSIVFFIILSPLKNRNKRILKIISLLSLIIGMLHRHNFIVTIYPILIWFTYDYLKAKNITNTKKYLFYFAGIMFINALILINIYYIFPRIFIKNISKIQANHIYALQIAGCAVPANDGSMIPNEWYENGKTFEDVKRTYNNNPYNADNFAVPWIQDKPFKTGMGNNVKVVWIKYILKYPKNYIKHIFNYAKRMWTLEYKLPSYLGIDYYALYDRAIKSDYSYADIDQYKKEKFYYENNGIKITDLKKHIHNICKYALPNINIFLFILISIIVFFTSGMFLLLKKEFRNDILVFVFSVSFSSIATVIIVSTFTPVVVWFQYRYIYPVIPISILSLIGFIVFIYDIGGIKKFIKELKSKDK